MSAETIVIGSRPAVCDTIIYGDPWVSPRHCRITRVCDHEGCVLLVEDLGSKDGTWVNGHRIYGPMQLLIGDRLRIGRREREIPPHAFWKDAT